MIKKKKKPLMRQPLENEDKQIINNNNESLNNNNENLTVKFDKENLTYEQPIILQGNARDTIGTDEHNETLGDKMNRNNAFNSTNEKKR